ncbi:MAG: DNA polymerase II large subunit [Candidatus Bathyarchaeia archaeon]
MDAASFHAEYSAQLEKLFKECYSIAEKARSLGYDPASQPESAVVTDLAERVEKSVGPPGVADRIRELSRKMPREEVAFKIAEEIAQTFSMVGEEEAAEQALRTALAILGEGVTVAPLQGISSVRVKTNPDNTRYLAVYFAGPIRSAGGTEMALILVVADYIQRLMGLDRYRATEAEARRFVEELRLYEREVARFQYKVSDDELFNVFMKLPVEVTGVQTDPVEVVSFRNLPRIETNGVRGGALRVVNDGLIGRTQKVIKIVEKLGIRGWSWLREIKPQTTDLEEAREFMYLEDVVGGRPIFSLPAAKGGFRLRYGRCRNTGLAALGVHPSTMHILRDFIAIGTQLRIEKPGKAGVVSVVDSIEPPIVKYADGSVQRVHDPHIAAKIAGSLTSILFLGDILVSYGEFLENNKPLAPSGFVEEWWSELLNETLCEKYGSVQDGSKILELEFERVNSFINSPLKSLPTPAEALKLSRKLSIPLHPRYTYFWSNLTPDEINRLRTGLLKTFKMVNREGMILEGLDTDLKTLLERLCVPHTVQNSKIIIPEGEVIYECLGLGGTWSPPGEPISGTEYVSKASGVPLKEKAPTYIGARMGRPEKAKRREMKPKVHCLFPIGLAGGPRRNIVEAAKSNGFVSVDLERRVCPYCREPTHMSICHRCGSQTLIEQLCPKCGRKVEGEKCPSCKIPTTTHEKRAVDVRFHLELAAKRLGMTTVPEVVKCVRGMTSESRRPEPLEKGLLRAKYDLSIFKDGTIRFDATNAPLTHFRPVEVGLSLKELANLGYGKDAYGMEILSLDQLCPLKVQDIIIPESCADYFVKVASFLDELLEKFYDLPPYYNVRRKEDLIGHLAVGLSPHTSVGVLARIIGFTKANVCFAHPLWHAAKRRDCDGDEDSIILLLDVLLNFSKAFLPRRIGGLMDAPLLLTLTVNPNEVARQAFNIETVERLPLEFFHEAEKGSDPKDVARLIETIGDRLENENLYSQVGFTHDTADINTGNLESVYKRLPSMLAKIEEQLRLANLVESVGAGEVAKKVLSTHLMRDLVGNLKAFASQQFRCSRCGSKFRRIPLRGACTKCGGKVSLTVHRGAIEKYLGVAERLVKNYDMGPYHEQRLRLIADEINSLFKDRYVQKQPNLIDFM